MKKAFAISMILVLLCAAGALAEEGVRVAGSKLPYVIGGAAAIAIGVLITVAMVASKEGRALVVTPTGLPIPVPLFPVLIGLAIGLTLINTTPKDSYTLNGVRYTLGEKTASANGPAKGAEVPEVLKLPAEVEGLPLTGVGGFDGSAGLREVVLPLSVTNLGPGVFKDCANLETVRFEGGTAPDDDMRWLWLSIGDEAFSGCEALKNLLFPNTQSIGERAFMGCAALTRVELPGVYAGVGKQAFSFYDRRSGKSLRLVLKPRPQGMSREQTFAYYQELAPEEMFDVKEPRLPMPGKAEVFESFICDGCGEQTGGKWIRVRDGRNLCPDCFEG